MGLGSSALGGRIKGTLGDIDPLNKVPLKRARSRVQKGYPLSFQSSGLEDMFHGVQGFEIFGALGCLDLRLSVFWDFGNLIHFRLHGFKV